VTAALIVPLKTPARAKQRLNGVLSEAERLRLARAMAEDVLGIVGEVREIARFAVSDDSDLLELARRFGIDAIADRESAGQSAAVRQGFIAASERGHRTVATIPGDVPAVRSDDLRQLLEARPAVDVLLVTDREGVGTNGLRLLSPDAIALHFGDDSRRLHEAEAERAGRSFALLEIQRLACDIDRPDDLAAFLRLAVPSATLTLLQGLQLSERLAQADHRRG
jgi:2-phospho-L-lactate/phosphoenolpyruvate guanylyltransferase